MAELGDAPALGAGAERRVGSTPTECICGDCSSAGRALDCGSEGRGFEPRQSPHADIAQSVEHHFGKVEVTSSILVVSLPQ